MVIVRHISDGNIDLSPFIGVNGDADADWFSECVGSEVLNAVQNRVYVISEDHKINTLNVVDGR